MSSHLRHIDDKRSESMEGLLMLLYDRADGGFSSPNLARIFIALGGNV